MVCGYIFQQKFQIFRKTWGDLIISIINFVPVRPLVGFAHASCQQNQVNQVSKPTSHWTSGIYRPIAFLFPLYHFPLPS